ncbi:MAG: lysophospholipid acyltransferase family protein [Candidatus Cloacimonadales bacterium]
MANKKKRSLGNRLLLFLEKYLGAALVLLFGASWRYTLRTPKPKEKNVIYAFWHRDMLPLLYLHRFTKLIILISSSQDGEIIAGPAHALGYQTARGSSTRGGSSALKKLIRQVREYPVAITPDGPKGPLYEVKDGALYLALLSRKPIIPVAVDAQREKIFNSWDKFRFPKLFSKINITYGEPIYLKSKTEIEAKRSELKNVLEKLAQENKLKKI